MGRAVFPIVSIFLSRFLPFRPARPAPSRNPPRIAPAAPPSSDPPSIRFPHPIQSGLAPRAVAGIPGSEPLYR